MARYLFQLRRGWKDNASDRNDGATYKTQTGNVKPLKSEFMPKYDNGKIIERAGAYTLSDISSPDIGTYI